MVIGIVVLIYFFSMNNKQPISNENETLGNQVYITQNSNVSPTGKEFIGTFSNKLTEIYEGNETTEKNIYNTSIENMLQYSNETKLTNNITKSKDIIEEEIYYYNSINNHIVGSKISFYSIEMIKKGLKENEMDIQSYVELFLQGENNIFRNYHNMEENTKNSTQEIEKNNKYQQCVSQYSDKESTNFDFDNYNCSYNVIGLDCLCVFTNFKNDSNKMEILLLAYDQNTSPEDIIKKWYNTVYKKEKINQDNVKSLLEEIYLKYPELRGKEGIICGDEENYWLLDKNGQKVYFYDLTSFETALKQCDITIDFNNNDDNLENNNSNIESNNNSNKTNSSNNSDGSNKENNLSKVPKLIGLKLSEAESKLSNTGIYINSIYVYTNSAQKNETIMEQSIPAGTKVTEGTINLKVYKYVSDIEIEIPFEIICNNFDSSKYGFEEILFNGNRVIAGYPENTVIYPNPYPVVFSSDKVINNSIKVEFYLDNKLIKSQTFNIGNLEGKEINSYGRITANKISMNITNEIN